MVHRNEPFTETGRLRLARCIVDDGWPIARAAERFQVSRPTATRWAARYREAGSAGMADRSSRPARSPRRTPQPVVRKIVHLRWKQRLGPVAIAGKVGLAPSTVHRDPARQHKMHGRPDLGYCYIHSAVEGYSRLAYSEALDDETATTALAFWALARAFFADHGITVDRVLTDNGSAYNSHAWRDEHTALGIKHSRTRVAGHRRMARSSGSTAPCSGNGITSGYTSERSRGAALSG